MNESRTKKRLYNSYNEITSSTHTNFKRPRNSGRDHVHKTQAQSVHEASTTSSSAPWRKFGESPPQRSALVGTPSSAPTKPFLSRKSHKPGPHQTQPLQPGQSRVDPQKLPPLPPITDADLESAVFTHSICLPGHNHEKLEKSYDRLEFLGDAYVELMATRLIYTRYPHLPAGRLSQQRESLVRNDSLADFSVAYGFEKRARLPPRVAAVSRSRFEKRLTDLQKQYIKMLGDVFEAYVAGVVLSNASNGYQIVEEWLHKLWIPMLEAQNSAEVHEPPPSDAKQQLMKRILARGVKMEFREADQPDLSESASGKTWFTIGAFFTGWGWNEERLGEGRALSKSMAGMIAATEALKNPVTKQIEEVRKEELEKRVAEQEVAQTLEGSPKVANQNGVGTDSYSRSPEMLENSENEKREVFDDPDDTDDADDSDDSEDSHDSHRP